MKITERKDKDKKAVTSTANAQRALENIVVRFRWVDGYLVAVEADSSANVDHVNFIKGILSALQVYSPVPSDGETTVSDRVFPRLKRKHSVPLSSFQLREEDVLGVCTTKYTFSKKGDQQLVTKKKDLATCSKDKLHLGSSPVLTSLLGPMVSD